MTIGATEQVIMAGTVIVLAAWVAGLVWEAFDGASWNRAKRRHRRAYPGVMATNEAREAYERFTQAAAEHEAKPTAQTALRMRHWRRVFERARARAEAEQPR